MCTKADIQTDTVNSLLYLGMNAIKALLSIDNHTYLLSRSDLGSSVSSHFAMCNAPRPGPGCVCVVTPSVTERLQPVEDRPLSRTQRDIRDT